MDKTKKCSRCGEEKELTHFYASGARCKKCRLEVQKEWNAENGDKLSERRKRLYIKHREKNLAIKRQYYLDNKEKLDEISRIYAKEHPEQMRAAWRKYGAKRRTTAKGKLNSSIACRVGFSLGQGVKAGRTWEELLGFTVDQLKKHLEKRFKPGMTWDNYGSHWSIDHKVPVAVYNFEHPDDIDFRLCWSLKNLQPLEVKLNSRKKDKIEKPFQPALALRVAQGGRYE
jgi:hypothetical protein